MKNYVFYDQTKHEIIIRNLSISRLKTRIRDTFSSTGINIVNGEKYLSLFNRMEYINWEETEISFFSFFALEIHELFSILAKEYTDPTYQDICEQLFNRTWISNYLNKDKITIDTLPMLQLTLKPKDFQLQFIKDYPTLKYQYDLDGYILSFEQGLGKTFTAIALGECLKKEIFYIVCPNSATEVWSGEIKKYYRKYKDNEELWKDEVFITNVSGYRLTPKTKFLITNQENIPALFNLIDTKKNSMIIIDESHNFRGTNTKRVQAMLKLKELSECHDCLLMSGTPIKATANEIVPSLRMIDPHFTPELAKLYEDTFSSTSTEGSAIVKARFRRVIYRKEKKYVLPDLPDKYVNDLKLKIPRPERYSTTKAKADMMDLFHKEYISRLESGLFTNNKKSPFYRASAGNYNFLEEQIRFENVVRKYSRAKKEITEMYLDKIFQRTEDNMNIKLINSQNVEDEYFKFLKKFVTPFVETREEKEIVTTRFNGIFGWAIAAKSATGTAIGTTISDYKNRCFMEIWDYNFQTIINMIQKNKKKTIIFSVQVPIVEHIFESLGKNGIEAVKVIGGTKTGRSASINDFKNNDKIQVMVATTESLSESWTFAEASQIFFFGTPYRRSDFDQACDRIHRIGQTDNCYIYNVLLWSYEKNITGRIEEIMSWSGEMFDSLINESDNSDIDLFKNLLNE